MSAHLLASDRSLQLMPSYNGELLPLITDLGDRLYKAYETPTKLPYAWVNLR